MAKPKLIPFVAEHLLQIASRNPFDDLLIDEAWRKEAKGPAFTAWLNDKPLACAGVMIVRPKVGYAWAVFGHDITNYRVWITRTIRNALRDIVKGCALHRVEAQMLESQHDYRRWIESFGFTLEGVAHDYTSDRANVVRYEWIRYNQVRILEIPSIAGERMFIAKIGDNIVGRAAHRYTPGDNYAYGTLCEVNWQYRGMGIGMALHQTRLDAARTDHSEFFVGNTDNPRMQHILEKCGARRTETPLGVVYVGKL